MGATSKQYVYFPWCSASVNEVINDAVEISGDTRCEKIGLGHFFLSLLKNTGYGENILEYYNMTWKEVYSNYIELVKKGMFGYFDSSDVPVSPENFSDSAFKVVTSGSIQFIIVHRQLQLEDFIDAVIAADESELKGFLGCLGMNLSEIVEISKKSIKIPEQLAEFVQDLREDKNVTKYTYVDKYSDEMIEVLSRKNKANPCLVGEAGVGKTSAVYALNQRIMSGNVPEYLKDVHIYYVNGSNLISGTRYRGDFEERIKDLMSWASQDNCILFLDELHTFLNSDNNSTAGNMIKKSLSDGTLRIIGATTIKEYHKYVEQDSAFDRRLQRIDFKEPSKAEAIEIINGSIRNFEQFHGIGIPDGLVEQAVNLSDRYIRDKFLPDKAFTILDQACARVKVNGGTSVTDDTILEVVSRITGINVARLSKEAKKGLLTLEDKLSAKVIGQEDAVKVVSKAIRRAKAEVSCQNKPLASFIFVGPTGVGKTELCRVLSKEVAFGDTPLIKIDMSEYADRFDVNKMIGSAPGFVGYGEGGQLTEKVKHNPYSIVLFDEIEKAHPDVFNIFLQILDEGHLTDGSGQTVDFSNCIIVMTSNAGYGADGMNKKKLGFVEDSKSITLKERERIAMEALESTFKPELLNRLDNIVIFNALTKEQCHDITRLSLDKLVERIMETKQIKLSYTDELVELITENGYSGKYGARNINREIQDTVEDKLSEAILSDEVLEGDAIEVDVDSNKEATIKVLSHQEPKEQSVKVVKKQVDIDEEKKSVRHITRIPAGEHELVDA